MPRRAVSIAAVILLHLAIVAALLQAVVVTPFEKPLREEREIVLPLTLPAPAHSSQAPTKGVEQRGLTVVPSAVPQNLFASPAPQAAEIGAALFGCTPERMASLSREEREKCERQNGFTYTAFAGLAMKLSPPPEKLSNADIAARYRNTVDPCMAAKATGTECIHEIIYGKGLP